MPVTIVCEAGTSRERFGPSKYHVAEHAYGFSLEEPARPRVQVSCRPTFLEVDVASFFDWGMRVLRQWRRGLLPPAGAHADDDLFGELFA